MLQSSSRSVACSLILLAACATPGQPGPVSGPIGDARVDVREPSPAAEAERADEATELSAGAEAEGQTAPTRALEACQAAEEALAAGQNELAVQRADLAYRLLLELPDEEAADSAQTKQDIRLLVARIVTRAYGATPGRPSTASKDLGLPSLENEHVQREIASFTGREREQLLAAIARAGRYRPMIADKLVEAGLPTQLSWLPLVESEFKVAALSRAGALGLWQFISSTGLRYGLRRDEWVDERLDPEKSTAAAIAYLADLHRLFGDWPKALAAYNCGESRVLRLQQRASGEYLDFWDLYGLLPGETRRYVPRLIAVLQIMADPAAYGLVIPEEEPPVPETQVVLVERPVELAKLEAGLGLEAGLLRSLNPALRHASTPKASFELRVPATVATQVATVAEALPEYRPPRPKYVLHRVRTGETLSQIAELYHTTVSRILQVNRLQSAHRIYVGQRLRIPSRG